ncbi:EamA family transporter [Nocardioides cheoyonin]|uniref:EamA family transporter n=1 Tax=Nocardioides cheoyonin TaxID=3156615 RepID=UPI0032B59DC6
MSPVVVAVVLASAVLHATWNALAHGIRDRLVGFALIGVAYTVLAGTLCAFVGLPEPRAWPFVLATVVLHAVYSLALFASYQLGEFSQVYPLARGTSPWVVAVVTVVVLGHRLPAWELVGVVVVSIGLLSLVFVGGIPGRDACPALGAALLTGLLIAAYTVVDGLGVHRTSVWTYAGWAFFLEGPVIPLVALRVRGRRLLADLRPSLWTGLVGGAVSLVAYGAVLWAQARGALAPIAALRETSIIVGSIIGAVFFHERFGPWRAVAAAVVAAGIVLINLG